MFNRSDIDGPIASTVQRMRAAPDGMVRTDIAGVDPDSIPYY